MVVGLSLSALVVYGVTTATARKTQPAHLPERVVAEHAPVESFASPADKAMKRAMLAVEVAPNYPDAYNQLCEAYLQKARETGDFSFNGRAEAALAKSFEVRPDNYEALKLKAVLLLTYHKFDEALKVARRAQQIEPRDPQIYGALVDAMVELGDYQGALKATETMMALRPDTASYSRVSYLESLHGNSEGAIKAMQAAIKYATSEENIAWCRVHLGEELIKAGKQDEAEREFDLALVQVPDYNLALTAKARALIARNDFDGAIELYKKAQARLPLPDTAIALGDLYTIQNRQREAAEQYKLVEFIEQSGDKAAATYSLHLALLWANQDRRIDEALAIALRERATRSDIYTCDVLAWALYKKERLPEAKQAIDEALRLGTRDAQINYHAGLIYNALGDRQTAKERLALALKINPSFDILQAKAARVALATL